MRTTVRLSFYLPKWNASLLGLLFFTAFSFSSVKAQLAGTYTIDPSQPAGSGNFQTFNQAIAALNAGITGPVVINVAPGSGPYNETIFLDHRVKTTATNTLTFNCNGVTLSFLSKDDDQHAGVLLDSIDYVTFDSLVVTPQAQNSDEFGFGFHLMHDADHNTIRRCTIINNHNPYEAQRNDNIIINGANTFGIDGGVSSCDSNIITHNHISGGFAGITLSSNPNWDQSPSLMKGNQVTYNTITDVETAGVFLNGYSANTLVQGNDITAPNAMWVRGIILFNVNESCVIQDNRIHHFNNVYGLSLTAITIGSNGSAGKENIVANNAIYDFNTDDEVIGIAIRDGIECSYVKILHNTIVFDNPATTAINNTEGIYLAYNASHVQVMNNIISITRATSAECYGLFFDANIPGFSSDRNNIYIASPTAAVNAIATIEWEPYTTLVDWQAVLSADMHSTSYDPLFADVATGNLKPGQGPINDMGQYVNIDTDITGAPRNTSAPDIGAYEFDGPPCSVPVAGTAMASTTNICEIHPVTLSLNGNSNGTGQTYQWQSDADMNGSFSTRVGTAQSTASFDIHPETTLYYRAAVTCGATTVYSTPIQVVVDPALAAGTYTIDAGKPAGGDNFRSFDDAIAAMHCGIRGHVVFEVAPGTYNQQVMIPAIPGTSSSKTVSFHGNGATLNYTSTNSNERAVIKLNGANYVTIDSFDITVSGAAVNEYGFGVQLINNADHNTISHCHITLNKKSAEMNFAGIVMSPEADKVVSDFVANDCDSNTITGNIITGGYYGIACSSNDFTAYTTGNVFTGNTLLDNHAAGIYVSATKKAVIEGNDISRPTRDTSYAFYMAIFANTHNMDLRISQNKIHNLSDGNKRSSAQIIGIFMSGTDASVGNPNTVSNNLVYNFNGLGLQQGLYAANAGYTRFYHNTVSLEDSSIWSTDVVQGTRGFAVLGATTTGLDFRNNSITVKRRGTVGQKYCIYIAPGTANLTSDYNNLFMADGPVNYVGYTATNNQNYQALTDWTSSTGKDAHSISVDPVYKDAANADFTPTVLPFDNKGVYVGIDKDFNGKPRSTSTPDIGAYEFFKCALFPVVHVAVDSQAVCTGAPVTFTVDQSEANTTYTWFDAKTNGNQVTTGTSYTINKLSEPVEFWIEGLTAEGCPSISRTRVKAINLAPLPGPPMVRVDSVGVNTIRFAWDAISGATAYEVSRDGVSFKTPTSGATGLTHTITGLNASDTASIVVRALAVLDCQQTLSARVSGHTLSSQYFIPNTFTPNGNGQNDVFKIYSNIIKSMRLTVFNQWGQKVFESTNPQIGWDGTFRGKQQPAGVYIYVAQIILTDGTAANQKGTLNLIR